MVIVDSCNASGSAHVVGVLLILMALQIANKVNRSTGGGGECWHANCLTFMTQRKFYHRVMYKAPSSGHISLNFNMPFKLILRRFEVGF